MTAPDDALPVVRAADLDEPDPSRRWLIDPLWASGGVGIIGGAPKACKSWLALDLAVSVASGTPCLDTFRVIDPGGVLLYMAEDAAATVKARLAGLCRHRQLDLAALPIDVITAPSVRLDLPLDQRRLAETIRRAAPRLLVLDPFVRLHRINENQAGDVAAILGYLRDLQRAHQVAILVVHHARKNGPSTGAVSLRGSSDFFAWVDSALSLRRRHAQLTLSVEHRAAAALDPLTLALAGTDGEMHLAVVNRPAEDPPRATPAADPLDASILTTLDRPDGLPRAALRASLHVRNERLGEALARLAAQGAIVRHGDRWVRMPIPVPTVTADAPRNGNRNASTPGG